MKIEYKFVDGTVTEIEVDGSLGEFMLELKNEGDRVERKETRRHVLLSAVDPEDRYYDSGRDTPEEIARKDELERLAAAIDKLQPQQRELLRRIYWNSEKQKDIAAEDGVSERAITGRMKKNLCCLKKIYGLGGSVFHFPWLICEGRKYGSSEREVMGMEHTLRISVSKEPASGGIVSCRHISVRERFLRFLLGEKRRLTIIVPGDSVQELAVSEVMEGGNVHAKTAVLYATAYLYEHREEADHHAMMEQFICDRIREMFITNEDGIQNIKGLLVSAVTATKDWSLHITPSEKGGHYNIVNLIDSVVIPAMEKYSILVKTKLDIQNREIRITVGRAAAGVITIESDLPNIIKKSVTIRQVSADVNKLIIYDASDYEKKRVYYLHSDLGYDTKDRDRITPVVCGMQAVSHEEGSSFESAAINAAHNKFANLSYSNLIELTMMNGDALVKPEELEFGQVADIISDGQSYRSILTGRERGRNTKLVFGTVRLDLTKILRRQENG